MLNPANVERLVRKLGKMRGAALKLGQMMSFQGMINFSLSCCHLCRSSTNV